MPVAVSYPGVYVEEIPSGVRTITGVATSITVFVGWAAKGPKDRAELVLSWTDFERKFGGLDNRSYLGYSVYQFFNNGGSKAYIMRLAAADSVTAKVPLGDLMIEANSPGEWANDYAIVTKKQSVDPTRFQLKVVNNSVNKKGIPVEVFENLSMVKGNPRYVKTVLKNESNFVNADATDETNAAVPDDTAVGDIPADAELKDGASGAVLTAVDADFITSLGDVAKEGGLLDRIDLFNLLCVPGLEEVAAISSLQKFCRQRRAFLIVDCKKAADSGDIDGGQPGNITTDDSINSAFYFPWVLAPD
ncbi:MAG: phage tail sheath family protein, partial [Acidobacteriota bacterium]